MAAQKSNNIRVYSDWTRQRQFDGVKHDTTHVSQSEHSDRPRHSAATDACVGIRSIIDALLNRDKEMSQSEVVALFLMPTIITGSIQTGRVNANLTATIRRLQKCIHTERVDALRITHSGYTISSYSIAVSLYEYLNRYMA